MAWNTITAGMKLTPARLNGLAVELAAYKTADTTRASTTSLTSDPDLTMSVVANAVYTVDLAVAYAITSVNGIVFSWTGPAGATMINWGWHARTPASVETSGTVATLTGQATLTTASGSTIQPIWAKGVLVTSSTAGTFAFQWAQQSSNATGTVVKAGSYLLLTRIA